MHQFAVCHPLFSRWVGKGFGKLRGSGFLLRLPQSLKTAVNTILLSWFSLSPCSTQSSYLCQQTTSGTADGQLPLRISLTDLLLQCFLEKMAMQENKAVHSTVTALSQLQFPGFHTHPPNEGLSSHRPAFSLPY